MKIARFIQERREDIAEDWLCSARALQLTPPDMPATALRTRARQMLDRVIGTLEPDAVADVRQDDMPHVPLRSTAVNGNGSRYAQRQTHDFSMANVIAEYRALRTSVLRLWFAQAESRHETAIDELVRFNETIDYALADFALSYSAEVAQTRDKFLAILGHDLRGPLSALSLAGDFLLRSNEGGESIKKVGTRIKKNTTTMAMLVDDLLEYASTQLGRDITVEITLSDLRKICEGAIEEASDAHPECPFELDAPEGLTGNVDGALLHQVLTNLLNNAAQYGCLDYPITLTARSEEDGAVIEVRNFGSVIPKESLETIFIPFLRLGDEAQPGGRAPLSVGLGLFIARELTLAHGGTISAQSSEGEGTIFTVRLPGVHPSN